MNGYDRRAWMRAKARAGRAAAWLAGAAGMAGAAVTPSFPPVDSEPLGRVPAGALVLHDAWQMREAVVAGDDGAAIAQPGFAATNWYATTVPTTVLAALVRHGVYPDPYIGTNNMAIPDASDTHNQRFNLGRFSHLPDKSNPWSRPWWFRTVFTAPADYRGKVAWLNLDGLNYRADVWLNGLPVATAADTAGMFRRYRFDVTRCLRPGAANALAVRVHGPDFPGDPLHEQLDGLQGKLGPNAGDGEITRNVTQGCTVGWDWVPAARDRNMGFWQHVWLEATGPVAVRDAAAFTDVKLPGGAEAAVTVRCHVQNADSRPQAVELAVRLAPEGFEGQAIEVLKPLTLPPGAPVEVVLKPAELPALVLRNPRLWWPVTYGGQPLYRLTVEARVGGQVSSRASSLVGVRSLGTYILPSGGRAFTVNGRTLRMTGGAWVPDFLLSWSAQRHRDEVRLMAEGNHTVVRINGCGVVPPDAFFEQCDRLGVLVWLDMARTGVCPTTRKDGVQSRDPLRCDPATYLANMTDVILRLRGCPSMFLWCGCNEDLPQEDIGRPLQDELLPRLDGTRPWIPSSSANPPWRKEDVALTTGGPWHMVRLPEYFRLYAVDKGFTGRDEIGLASVPTINAVARSMPDHERPDARTFPLNRTLGYHDASDNPMRQLDRIMREDIGAPASLAEYLWMGDLYNSAVYRAIFEAANKVRPRNAGTHIWKTNAAWPSFMWQLVDWYLRPNAGYYSMRSACKPLHVQYSVNDHAVQVVSTLPADRPGLRVRLTLVDLAGKVAHTEERPVNAPADATVPAGMLPTPARDGRLHILGLDLLDAQGAELDRTVTWVQKDCKWQELLKLAPATVTAQVLERGIEGAETVCRIAVVNASKAPALQVWLAVLGGPQGEEVLPSFWSDNALNLLPGERRTVTVRYRTASAGATPGCLITEGWNVTPREIALADGREAPLALRVTACEARAGAEGAELTFDAVQSGPAGSRWTTWPVAVEVDGAVVRYARLALRTGTPARAVVTLGKLPAGEHRVRAGDGPLVVLRTP